MVKEDSTTFKYGQPLFAAAWPRGKFVFVCGGGGSANSGIQSRVVAATFQDGKISDEIGSVTLKQTGDGLCFLPGSKLLLVLSGGKIVPFDVHIKGNKCQFIVPQGDVIQAFQRLAEVPIKAMACSPDGSWLAFGTSQGGLHVWQRDGLTERTVQQIKVAGEPVLKQVTGIDFSPTQTENATSHTVAATCEDGNCYLCAFKLPEKAAAALPGISPAEATTAVLSKPADMKNGMLKHCKFLSDGRLVASIVHRARACIVVWKPTSGGFEIAGSSKSFNPVTGLDVSPDGLHVGVATAEGEAFWLDSRSLRVKKSLKKAHMVFATSVAFAGDCHAFVSTSADASVRIVTLPIPSYPRCYSLLLALFLVLLLVLAMAVLLAPS